MPRGCPDMPQMMPHTCPSSFWVLKVVNQSYWLSKSGENWRKKFMEKSCQKKKTRPQYQFLGSETNSEVFKHGWEDVLFVSDQKNKNCGPHVLVHLLKSCRAYNVKSFSTVFSDNIQWNFKISFSCVRLNNQLGYNLITENWDHQKWDFCQNGASENWRRRENSLSCVICCFEKHLLGFLLNLICIKIAYNIFFIHTNF